jgi:hypothetical protein
MKMKAEELLNVKVVYEWLTSNVVKNEIDWKYAEMLDDILLEHEEEKVFTCKKCGKKINLDEIDFWFLGTEHFEEFTDTEDLICLECGKEL